MISNQKVNIEDIDYSDSDNECINVTIKELANFISKNTCKIGDKSFTHTLLDGIKNTIFKVSDEEYASFIELYQKTMEKNFGKLHILEKPMDNGPLCLDFDLRQNSNKRKFNLDHIRLIVEVINNNIKKYFKIINNEELFAYILIKKEPFYDTKKNIYKDGFHIQYPNITLNVNDRFVIFNETKKYIVENNILYELLDEIENNIDEVFDNSVIKKNSWYLYGSGKKINNYTQFYDLVYILDKHCELIKDKILFNKKLLVEKLAIRYNKKQLLPVTDMTELYKLNKNKINTNTKNESIDLIEQKEYIYEEKESIESYSQSSPEDIKNAKRLITLLSKKRAIPYNDWLPVGWALYNTSPTLLKDFITFSKLAPNKYTEGCCEKVWDECARYNMLNPTNNSGYTIASLYKWAKDDNPKGYNDFIIENINSMFETMESKTDFDIAVTIHEMYKHEYVCSSISKNVWWQFVNNRWMRIDNAYTLSIKLSTEVSKHFKLIASKYMADSAKVEGKQSEILIRQSQELTKLILDMKKKAYKDRIIAEASTLFYDANFEEKLDANMFLLGFDNGIYDLSKGIFRDGCPDDYVSKTTGYDYHVFDTNDKLVIEIENFFKSIQPKDDVKNYLLCYFASMLSGDNRDQKLVIFTGPGGSNGKSTSIDLLTHTLGNYAGTLPVTLLTVKRKSSSNATPELADKKGVRFLVLNEPEEGDVINVGYMKELTGQDKIMARKLFGDPFYYTPQFKILVACNKKPQIPSDDGGTWRRLRVVDFNQRFVDNPVKPNEHPKDPELRNKLPNWKQAFMWLLINKYYKIYKETTLDKLEPQSIKMSTEQYKEDSNVFMEFITQQINITNDQNDKESFDALWATFSEWHKTSYEHEKRPPKKKLLEFFKSNDYNIKGTKVHGIKFIDNYEEDDKASPLDY